MEINPPLRTQSPSARICPAIGKATTGLAWGDSSGAYAPRPH